MRSEFDQCPLTALYRVCEYIESCTTESKPFAYMDDSLSIEAEKAFVDDARLILRTLEESGVNGVIFCECTDKPRPMTIGGSWLYQLIYRFDTWHTY